MTESTSWIFSFGEGRADGDGQDRLRLGGKGAGLAGMTAMGIPVPPGFTISTEVTTRYVRGSGEMPAGLEEALAPALALLETRMQRTLGDVERPLLVSVRSGARASMPGMMDTILNVGLNEETVHGLAAMTGQPRFAWDSYRRLIQMFGAVVLGVHHFYFEEELHAVRQEAGVRTDDALEVEHLQKLVDRYRRLVKERTGRDFPQSPREQLHRAIVAVFESWYNDRAEAYREMHGIPRTWGTAVNVQAMVFGNLGETSGTGVCFTRNPSTGEPGLYGEYLLNAQGEDVVAGIRTPLPIMSEDPSARPLGAVLPQAWASLLDMQARLEAHYRDMQDIEFTIEQGRVWILQTRNGKRTAAAEVRIAVDLAQEGVLSRAEALQRVAASRIDSLLHPTIDARATLDVLAKGLPASPGAATGRLAFTAREAEDLAAAGVPCILVREETSPDDIRGMKAAEAIVTARGGMTSHAAVVARQMGKCCVVGTQALRIDAAARQVRVGDRVFGPEDTWSVDGATGTVLLGRAPLVPAQLTPAFHTLMEWADEARTLGIRTNADNGADATLARRLGARGIGLTRTEHMFFEGERIHAMREMILAHDRPSREKALAQLRPLQTSDFAEIFEAMDGLPVTVRLLDPPLHEFLPDQARDIALMAERMGRTPEQIHQAIERLTEANPMLGHRGCRLGLTYPEIYRMQVGALLDATVLRWEAGGDPRPEIMVPLVAVAEELAQIRAMVGELIDAEYGAWAPRLRTIPIGTMIELPRACLVADRIAAHADFLSFGTNDLTQTTYGFSRDDVSTFLPDYLRLGLLQADPFVTLDADGVVALMRMAVEKARSVNPDIKVGLCGEHGGDPVSIGLVNGWLDYVSCSPWRVPVARLAGAQVALEAEGVRA
jgi:pyruvate,orthophosphate dikinase